MESRVSWCIMFAFLFVGFVYSAEICTCVHQNSGSMRMVADTNECRQPEYPMCWDTPTNTAPPGNRFVVWGSTQAPEGTTLIYAGYGFASHDGHASNHNPIVIKEGDPGGPINSFKNRLYFLLTADDAFAMPPGISSYSYVKGAVVFVEAPTVTIWGSHLAPVGWEIIYTGYAMGAHYQDSGGSVGPLCVNSEDFEAEEPRTSSASTLYGTAIDHAPLGHSRERFLKCAVCRKEAE